MSIQSVSVEEALIAIPLMALTIFATRLFPFAFFSKREPPELFRYVGKYLPPLVMAVLIVYSLKEIAFRVAPYGIAELGACVFTVVVHIWKKNAMLSIFGGTIVFMLLR